MDKSEKIILESLESSESEEWYNVENATFEELFTNVKEPWRYNLTIDNRLFLQDYGEEALEKLLLLVKLYHKVEVKDLERDTMFYLEKVILEEDVSNHIPRID